MPRFNAPAPPLIGDAIRLTIQYTGFGRTPLTVLDYIMTTGSAGSAAQLTSFLTAWRAAVEPSLKAALPTAVSITQYTVAAVSRSDIPSIVVGVAVPGTDVNAPLPSFVAAHARKSTSLKGQHGRGRTAWPFVPTDFTTPGTDPNKLNLGGSVAYGLIHTALDAGVSWAGPSTATPALLTRPVAPATLVTNGISPVIFNIQPFLMPARTREEYRVP